MPTVDASGEAESEELAIIKGSPPDLLKPLVCCPFAPRCDYTFDLCWQERPPLISVGEGHEAACFYDVTHDRLRVDSVR
jgi:oligopeptide/dipeptide ABC transporter ATP-binding protein